MLLKNNGVAAVLLKGAKQISPETAIFYGFHLETITLDGPLQKKYKSHG